MSFVRKNPALTKFLTKYRAVEHHFSCLRSPFYILPHFHASY